MKKIICILFSFVVLSLSSSLAVTAYPDVLLYEQPDGTQLSIRLHGDEVFNYVTTEDGYLLTEVDGVYDYATLTTDGRFISLSVKANNPLQRTLTERELLKQLSQNVISDTDIDRYRILKHLDRQGGFEEQTPNGLRGHQKALVILVEFPDQAFLTPNPVEKFSNLLNQKGYKDNGATGSAADYFEASTFGLFQPEFDVVGPYMLPQNSVYYGENVSGFDGRPREMIEDACVLANSDVDFSLYDADGNGNVDNVFVYYAGYNEAEGGGVSTIWPHHWNLAPKLYLDGVAVYSYACTSELRGNSEAQMCGIGTFVHEFSHVLGLTDFYPTNGASHHTLDAWDVMDRGPYTNMGRTPPTYSAYERFYLGYLTPQQITRSQLCVLEPLITSNKAYLISSSWHNLSATNPNPTQFYLLENRQSIGWDSVALPGHGLLVTCVKFNPQRWSANTVNNKSSDMGVDIIEADELTTNLAGDPFPGESNVHELDEFIGTDYELANITEQDTMIIFKFLDDDDDDDVSDVTISQSRLIFETEQLVASAVQSVVVASTCLTEDLELSFDRGDYFQMQTTNGEWSSDDLILKPEVGKEVVVERINIRYLPTTVSDEYGHFDYLTARNHDNHVDVDLLGYASPCELAIPLALPATDITSTSFVAHWQSVKGATAYYLLVDRGYDYDDYYYRHYDFDDQTILCIPDTFCCITDLMPSIDYIYQVSATNSVNVDYPEYVTPPSNFIEVETLGDITSQIEGITYDNSGLFVNASEPIYIYNAQGQLWDVILPMASSQYIDLPRGQIYLIKSGTHYLKIAF